MTQKICMSLTAIMVLGGRLTLNLLMTLWYGEGLITGRTGYSRSPRSQPVQGCAKTIIFIVFLHPESNL